MSSLLFRKLIAAAALSLLLAACAPRHEYRPLPIKSIDTYYNRTAAGSGSVAAEAFYDDNQLIQLFGYNIRKAGVLPVRLMADNRGPDMLTILPGATLTDARGQTWELLPQDVVIRRIDQYTGSGVSGSDGVRRTAKGAVAGAILGAAVGVVTGTNVGSAAGKGAAAGGAIGATSAILGIGADGDKTGEISRDFSNMALQQSSVGPGEEIRGLLYYPAEADRPVRLNLKVSSGQQVQSLALPL
ncbi:MAG: hypothetical protein LBK52_07580 [Deltaproteobacteria bacterium]|jgi:hypothetical protein|nr:hypothetical protein [Deltaproteobacteria bacterium]